MPFGCYRKPYFPEREIRAFADKANSTRTLLIHADFKDTLNSASHLFGMGNTLCVYCDPPYLRFSGRDNFTAYGKPFDEDEHVRLRAALDRLSQETGGMTSIHHLQFRHTGNQTHLSGLPDERHPGTTKRWRKNPRTRTGGYRHPETVRRMRSPWRWLLPGLRTGNGRCNLQRDVNHRQYVNNQ
ncbi:DNA adenine methylase from prophage [Escherichia coli]|nr:DNA adenine methylase from prophage [Escherichia coli]